MESLMILRSIHDLIETEKETTKLWKREGRRQKPILVLTAAWGGCSCGTLLWQQPEVVVPVGLSAVEWAAVRRRFCLCFSS